MLAGEMLITLTSNTTSSFRCLANIFEENEAVIRIILKGRNPTMRHLTRTQGVALDRLFDRMNLDPKIKIKYVDTKNQLADILTKGSFTRDEGNHDLCQFNIMSNSMSSCSNLRNQIKDPRTKLKRQGSARVLQNVPINVLHTARRTMRWRTA